MESISSKNTTLVKCKWENRKILLCYIIIDNSGTTFYLEDLNKEDKLVLIHKKLVVEGWGVGRRT